MKQMMKQMGIKTEDIDATAVVIIGSDKEIVIEGPEVVKMTMSGKDIYTVTGGKVKLQDTETSVKISDEDVKMVAEQANVPEDIAREALKQTKGDLAEAIMKIKG
jgi:nascent polypeptide-associated complex subunit alpha